MNFREVDVCLKHKLNTQVEIKEGIFKEKVYIVTNIKSSDGYEFDANLKWLYKYNYNDYNPEYNQKVKWNSYTTKLIVWKLAQALSLL